MKKYLILNSSVSELNEGGFVSQDVCDKYPGSRWLHHLHAGLCGQLVWMSADTALKRLWEKDIHGSECVLLQEAYNAAWSQLHNVSALDTVLYNLESPMYAPYFYDLLRENKLPPFVTRFGFPYDGKHKALFPAYDVEDVRWHGTRMDKTVCVLSNKWWQLMPGLGRAMSSSRAFKQAIENEQHTHRLKRIIELLPDRIELYGAGWEQHDHFGIQELYGTKILPVENKLDQMQCFTHALTYENVDMEWYVTEKSIDAIASGCTWETNREAYEAIERSASGLMTPDSLRAWLCETWKTNPFSYRNMATLMHQEIAKICNL